LIEAIESGQGERPSRKESTGTERRTSTLASCSAVGTFDLCTAAFVFRDTSVASSSVIAPSAPSRALLLPSNESSCEVLLKRTLSRTLLLAMPPLVRLMRGVLVPDGSTSLGGSEAHFVHLLKRWGLRRVERYALRSLGAFAARRSLGALKISH
jgi:hypothetical protein